MVNLDQTDRQLLALAQRDAALSLEAMAEELSISTNTVWRRMKRLEDEGVIVRRVSIIDPLAIGLKQTVFVAIRTDNHSDAWLQRLATAISEIPEIVEFYRMAGDVDYLAKVQCQDVAHYDRIYKTLIRKIELSDISATFAMECLVNSTELPLGHL